jgi:mannose-6-phosphate isomerase-like protein (cupin superfamily)
MSARVLSTTLPLVIAAGVWIGAQEAPKRQEFWVQKIKETVYVPPNKPLTKLADLKAKYKGQGAWKETVLKDGESQADYASMVPGTKVSPRLHPATPTLVVVFEGEMRWQIENQESFVAKRGSMVNIPSWTIFSYEVIGTVPAVFIEVNAIHFDNVFPATDRRPKFTGASGCKGRVQPAQPLRTGAQ